MSVFLRRLCALFALIGSHAVAQQQTTAHNQPNLAGRWIATGYACTQRPAPKEEIIDISQQGSAVTAMKVKGDPCIGDGEMTWKGTINGTSFPVKINAWFGNNDHRLVDGTVAFSGHQITLHTPNTMEGVITFRRAGDSPESKNYPNNCGLNAQSDLATRVQSGQSNLCIRKCENKSNLWFEGSPAGGHHYLELNSLGTSLLSAQDVISILKQHIEQIFPAGARGLDGHTVEKGRHFVVTFDLVLGMQGYSNVICTSSLPYQFTFETSPGQHILRGDITFGVFKDSCGELWLFQQGKGTANEGEGRARFNYLTARPLWERMAENLRFYMDSAVATLH